MVDTNSGATNQSELYRIGAVCRLTGISQHVLRVWEKRYGVVDPVRGENQRRLYSEQDITKLSLLKSLVDRGQAIGSIAGLDTDELERRLQQSGDRLATPRSTVKPRLALFGRSLDAQVKACNNSQIFEFVGHYDHTRIDADLPDDAIDVAVIEWPSLLPETLPELSRFTNRLGSRHAILIYSYAPRAALEHLQNERITALRSPLDLAAVEAVVAWRFGYSADADDQTAVYRQPPPARQYTDRELTYLASITSDIACECPRHLAQLITGLVRFEAYSAECESRSAADAALHAHLYAVTARARHALEQALDRIVAEEEITLADAD